MYNHTIENDQERVKDQLKSQWEVLTKVINTEGVFVRGKDHKEESAPGLIRQIAFERIPATGEICMWATVRLGYQLGRQADVGDIEWLVKLDESECLDILNSANRLNLPFQQRAEDFKVDPQQVVEKGENILLTHLAGKGKKPKLTIANNLREVKREEMEEQEVVIASENEWDQSTLLNNLAEAIEFDNEAGYWEGGERRIPFSELATLTKMLADPQFEERVLNSEWQLDPYRDKEERARLIEFIDTLNGWGSKSGHAGWGERLTERWEAKRRIVGGEVRQILERADCPVRKLSQKEIDQLVRYFDTTGAVPTKGLEAACMASLRLSSEDSKRDWDKEWGVFADGLMNRIREYWTREMMRRWLRGEIDQHQMSQVSVNLAHILKREAGPNGLNISMAEVYDYTTHYFGRTQRRGVWERNNPKAPPLQEINKVVEKYFSKHYLDQQEWENGEIFAILKEQFRNRTGSKRKLDPQWIVQAKEIFEASVRGREDVAAGEWGRLIGEIGVAGFGVWSEERAVRIRYLTSRTEKTDSLREKLAEQNNVLPELNDVWRLWKRERARILQRWAMPSRIGMVLTLYQNLMRQDAMQRAQINSVHFDDHREMQILAEYGVDLYKLLRRYKTLSDDLSMRMSKDVGEYLNQLAWQGEVAERFGRTEIFSPIGAYWREALEQACTAEESETEPEQVILEWPDQVKDKQDDDSIATDQGE